MIERKYYYINGQPKCEYSYNYKGQRHGITKWWYYNGQLRYKTLYHEGQKQGIEEWWYKNGQLHNKYYHLYGDVVSEEEYRRHELIVKLSGL